MDSVIQHLQWVHVSEGTHGNPNAEYAIAGRYVYERTPVEGGYSFRRALWASVIESTSLLDQPMGIWTSVNDKDEPIT